MQKQIIRTNLETVLCDLSLFDDEHIYELSEEDLFKFVDLYTQGKELPRILLLSGNTAFDNLSGDCFGEDFKTREQAIQYLHGMSYEEIMENTEEEISL